MANTGPYIPDGLEKAEGDSVKPVENDVQPFHIGQSYETENATPQRCSTCGSRHFEIALGCWFTAIRCPTCGWEECIHDG